MPCLYCPSPASNQATPIPCPRCAKRMEDKVTTLLGQLTVHAAKQIILRQLPPVTVRSIIHSENGK